MTREAKRGLRAVGLGGALLTAALVLSGCAPASPRTASTDDTAAAPAPASTQPSTPAASVPAEAAGPAPEVLGVGAVPASVSIPAIALDEPLISLGIKPDGTMYVPAEWNDVGWFEGGGRPGGRGPTVIAAHVDSVTEPAIFSRLDELVVGDQVSVTDVDGSVWDYRVYEVAEVPKAEFPTVRVFGALPGDELRLITCGGVFDTTAASYVSNRIVYAERMPA